MKFTGFLFIFLLVLAACDQQAPVVTPVENAAGSQPTGFFPVTDFIQGQISEIRNKGINPLQVTSRNGKTDSAWLNIDTLQRAFTDFLSPVIDSNSLQGLFVEKSFLDQTINSFTLTYDPAHALPDSVQLQHWDVYIDPQENKVTRIYLVKKINRKLTRQLTWLTGKKAKTVNIVTDSAGRDKVAEEITIKWDFKEE